MTLLDELDKVIDKLQEEVKAGDPYGFWTSIMSMLARWKANVICGHFDEGERRRDSGGTFRALSDDGLLLEGELAQTILRVADRYVRNEI
jgi:hypothetical protein